MNTQEQETAAVSQLRLDKVPGQAIKVITNPVGFYQGMASSGGLFEPLVFMVVLSVLAGVLTAALSLFGLGAAGVLAGGLMAIIMVPIFVVIFGFIVAAIAYGIWKLLGSAEDFATAFRCVAYAAAIAPVTSVLNLIPYLGSLIGALWPMALLALASIHVHRISVQKSWAVFGAIGIILAFISVSGEHAGRQMKDGIEDWQTIFEEQE
jgi:hypothetical protein